MSTVNPLAREISAKIVYYGPGMSGKTTTLKHIHASLRPESRGQLISLSTEGDRTLFFDFLPLRIEQVRGLTLRLQLYTVPGQVFYDATRKLVLNGADGVVFVADSQASATDSNEESMANLEQNLSELGVELRRFPFVLQYNKRDLPTALPIPVLRARLNGHGVPEFETVARSGAGVLPALSEITHLVVKDLNARHPRRGAARMVMSAGGSELAERISAAAEAGRGAGPEASSPTGLSFTRLFPARSAAVGAVENAIRERKFGVAVRASAQALADVLASLPVPDARAAARAALLGLDGREFLRLGQLANKPNEGATEQDALFALYMLVSALVKAERL